MNNKRLTKSEEPGRFHLVLVGHVDHGKSTLIGRLLFDTGCLPEEKIKEIKQASQSLGKEMEFAYVMDHLEEERSKGKTIDTAQVFFKTEKRRYVVIDAPGHKEFLKNMITGSSQAEAALILVDVNEGIKEQTRRHGYLLKILGVKQIAVLINKMDLVDYSEDRFNIISKEITQLLDQLSIRPSFIIPISAGNGENIARKGEKLSWFKGPTLFDALDIFVEFDREEKGLRFPVQDVYEICGSKIAVGCVESGMMRKGQELLVLPEKKQVTLTAIEKFNEKKIETASSKECIGIRIDKSVARGQVLVSASEFNAAPQVVQDIHANLFWMSDVAYQRGEFVTFKCVTQELGARIEKIYKRFDPATIEVTEEDALEIGNAEIAEVNIHFEKLVVFDRFTEIPEMGRFVLEKEGHPVAGGIIL